MNSKDYWQSRSEQNIMSADKSAEELLKIMKESYNQANKLIRNEIDNFYSRFSYNQKISYEETLKRMDKKELKQFREQAWEYYKEAYDKNWETAYTDKMRTLSGKAYMSRLEGLKVNIAYQYQKIAEELNVKLEEGLTKQYEKSFEQTMFDVAKGTGMGLDVTRINSDIVKKTIERKWMSGNYSSRIWENKEKLVSTLNSTLPVLFTLGKSPNECAKVLSDKLDSNYKNCVRLVRTEFTHIANESSADAYKECGIDQYEYLATLDQRTDDLCGELDGKVFKVGDKQVGVNFPPMHPNCRCTTVAHFPDDYTERIAKDEKGKYFYVDPKTTFKDWKEMVKGGSRETGAEVVAEKMREQNEKFKFVPAESKEDATAYAKLFAENVDYDKMSLDRINIVNKALTNLFNKFKIKRLDYIDARPLKGRALMSASGKHLNINPNNTGNNQSKHFTKIYESKMQDIKNIEETLSSGMINGRKLTPPVRKNYEKTLNRLKSEIEYSRWGVSQSYKDNATEPNIYHEFGHVISDQVFGMVNHGYGIVDKNRKQELEYITNETFQKAKSTNDIKGVSQYGATNSQEFFAEVFAMKMMGEKLPEYIDDMLEETLSHVKL